MLGESCHKVFQKRVDHILDVQCSKFDWKWLRSLVDSTQSDAGIAVFTRESVAARSLQVVVGSLVAGIGHALSKLGNFANIQWRFLPSEDMQGPEYP